MTLDEKLDGLMGVFPNNASAMVLRGWLKMRLLETARDQRHACAEAVNNVRPVSPFGEQDRIWKDAAHQAVMNTPVLLKSSKL